MREHRATRTLLKSAPELWLACSEVESLGRHLAPFGEIRITRLEPESTVAWEGEAVSGTVLIEPSGWGTRVTLSAAAEEAMVQPPAEEATADTRAETASSAGDAEGEPADAGHAPDPRVGAAARVSLWTWLIQRHRRALGVPGAVSTEAPVSVEKPVSTTETPEADSGPECVDSSAPAFDPEAALAAALESLGTAHHRPFSRA
jgi:hypothetical protein